MPLKQSSRHNLEAERDVALNRMYNIEAARDDALNMIQQLLAWNSEYDDGLLATEIIILKNKLAQSEIESTNLAEKCLELEQTFRRSKLLRRDEEAECERLLSEAIRVKAELVDVKAKLMLKVESLKADHKEAMDLVKQRDEAIAIFSTDSHQLHKELKAKNDKIALLKVTLESEKSKFRAQLGRQSSDQARIKELEGLIKAEDAVHKDCESSELNAQAEIGRLESVTAPMDAERTTLCKQHHARSKAQQGYNEGLLEAKEAELELVNAQDLKEHEAQSIKAGKTAGEGEVALKEVERHRDELVKTVGQLYGQMSRMEEVDLMEGVEGGSGNSRKRQSDGDENPRPAKMPRIE